MTRDIRAVSSSIAEAAVLTDAMFAENADAMAHYQTVKTAELISAINAKLTEHQIINLIAALTYAYSRQVVIPHSADLNSIIALLQKVADEHETAVPRQVVEVDVPDDMAATPLMEQLQQDYIPGSGT